MLDPTDSLIARLPTGDQTTTGNPSAGAYGDDPEPIGSPIPPNQFEPLADIQAIATGAAVTVRSESPPDYWLVTVSATANAEVAVYQGSGAAGVPVRLYGGWKARIPGRSNADLTVVGVAGTPDVNVIAVRGYESWIQ